MHFIESIGILVLIWPLLMLILDLTFANGFKAPPWRQIYGEISYLQAQCHDKEVFIITASKKGYFINKGYTPDASGSEVLNYEAMSKIYGTLIELLTESSAHFASHIDQQEFVYHKPAKGTGLTAVAAEAIHPPESSVTETTEKTTRDSVFRRDDSAKEPKDGKKKQKAPKAGSGSAEPSLKWRALELRDDSGKDKKARPIEKKRPVSTKKDAKHRSMRSSLDDDFEESEDEEYSEDEQPEKRNDGCKCPSCNYSH